MGEQKRLLIDGCNAKGPRASGRVVSDRMASDLEDARIWCHCAGEDFDQRRLPRAVFADQRVHLAGAKLEAGVPESVNTCKRLRDRVCMQEGRRFSSHFSPADDQQVSAGALDDPCRNVFGHHKPSVGTSADTARTSACATARGAWLARNSD